MSESREFRISASTLLPIGAAMSIIGGAIWVTWMVAGWTGRLGSVEKDQADAHARMGVVETKIDGIAKDLGDVATTLRERSVEFVTSQRMRAWRRKLAHDNPTVSIPEWDE